MLLGDILAHGARVRPGHTALIAEGASLSYGNLAREAGRHEAALRALGVRRGDRVAALAHSTPAYVECRLVDTVERRGVRALPAADLLRLPGLYRGARCLLTAGVSATPEAVALVRGLWEGVGMRVEVMDAAAHDRILAVISHLPHVVAYALVNAAAAAETSAG